MNLSTITTIELAQKFADILISTNKTVEQVIKRFPTKLDPTFVFDAIHNHTSTCCCSRCGWWIDRMECDEDYDDEIVCYECSEQLNES